MTQKVRFQMGFISFNLCSKQQLIKQLSNMINHPTQEDIDHIKQYYADMYAAKGNGETLAVYDKYAEIYNKCCTDLKHYKCPLYPAKYLSSINTPKDIKIVDVGCGPGPAAQALKEQGFTNIVGVDGSEELLKFAKENKLFKEVHKRMIGQDQLGEELEGQFDVIVCTGSLLKTHIHFNEFKEMMKMIDLKSPHHLMCLTIRKTAYESENWRKFFADLEGDGFVNKLYMQKTIRYDENIKVEEWKQNMEGYLIVLEVLKTE